MIRKNFGCAGSCAQLPTQPKFFPIIFKLIQQFIMVILSCLAKKNQNSNSRKKIQFITEWCLFKAEMPANFPF